MLRIFFPEQNFYKLIAAYKQDEYISVSFITTFKPIEKEHDIFKLIFWLIYWYKSVVLKDLGCHLTIFINCGNIKYYKNDYVNLSL